MAMSANLVGRAESPPVKLATPEETQAVVTRTLHKHHLLRYADLRKLSDEGSAGRELIHGLLRSRSIGIGVGDSGLGKSPWFYQLGLCVAAGVPFLGLAVEQGRVVYVDLENGLEESKTLMETLARYLGLPQVPDNFLFSNGEGFLSALQPGFFDEIKPDLLIIDSLRSWRPHAEESNTQAAETLNELKRITRKHDCSVLLVHHIKKPQGEFGTPPLGNTPVRTWLVEACGARALINQSDVRMGFDMDNTADVLVWRYFMRLQGEFGPILLERVFDSDEPVGYRRLAGIKRLGNPKQEAALRALPQEFTFGEAMRAYGCSDDPTNKFLQKSIRMGLLQKMGKRGPYLKLVELIE